MTQYPQRDGEPDCRDYLRTGRCKYGESCKYHHPVGGAKTPSDPREPPFPIRPNEPPCQYYLKHGTCKFGQTCKFHHPAHILATGGTGATVYMNLGSVNILAQQKCCSFVNDDRDVNGAVNECHPNRSFVQLLPQRPAEADCIYFLRNGRCKYGATCKYHHPTNSFNLETGMHRSSSQQPHFDGRERSISDPTISQVSSGLLLNHHQPSRKNSGIQEGVATHVLYRTEGSTVVVPVTQGSAFQHLRGNTVSNGYGHETTHRKVGGKYRKSDHPSRNSSPLSYDKVSSSIEFIPASFQHQQQQQAQQVHRDLSPTQGSHTHTDTEDSRWRGYHTTPDASKHEDQDSDGDQSRIDRAHSAPNIQSSLAPHGSTHRTSLHPRTSSCDDLPRSRYHQAYNTAESSRMHKEYYDHGRNQAQIDTMSTSPNEPGRQWSSVSTSSSYQSNELHWDDSSFKRAQDIVCTDTSEPISGSKNINLISNTNASRRGQASNYDDGLSMMTSALLTMLDSPEEEEEHKGVQSHEETNSFYSDLGSRNGSPPPSSNGSKTKFDINDQSYTWFSNFPGLDPGMNEPGAFQGDVPCQEDNIFNPFTNLNSGDTSPRWLGQSATIPQLERNSQAVSALQASVSTASSQLFLPM